MTRTDPTGLSDVRAGLRTEMDRRWNRVRGHVRRALAQTSSRDGLVSAPDPDVRRLVLEHLVHHVGGRDGSWLHSYLETASRRASARVGRLVSVGPHSSSPSPSLPICHLASATHLASICADTATSAGEAAAGGLLRHPGRGPSRRAVDRELLRGRSRSRALAEHAVTQAHAQATLDALRAAGIERVGSVSEHRSLRDVDMTMSKPEAGYADQSPVAGEECAGCDMFRAPAGCTLVRGIIEPGGWCRHWEESSRYEAAGVMFVTPEGEALFLRRTDGEGWALPGGGLEGPETPEVAAVREAQEEVGGGPVGPLEHLTTSRGPVTFHTFLARVPFRFEPHLNHEHDDYAWALLGEPPSPLHPGVAWTLGRMQSPSASVDVDGGLPGETLDAGWEDEPRDDHGKWTSGMSNEDWYAAMGFKPLENWHAKPKGTVHAPQYGIHLATEKPKPLSYSREALPVVAASSAAASEANHGQHSWKDAPTTTEGWAKVIGQMHHLAEPPLRADSPHQRLASGVVMRELDGRIWVVHPKNAFGGYLATFPKGGVEEGLSPQANAIKEAFEESGLRARITGLLGDFRRTTSKTRYYWAERVGGNLKSRGWETESVSLVRPEHLRIVADNPHDEPVIKAILGETVDVEAWWRSGHSGKFVTKAHAAALDPDQEWSGPEEEEVDVQTAEDDRVCETCDDIASGGPYEIDYARDLIPAHPFCRCVFVPA